MTKLPELEKIKFFKYHGTGNDFIIIDNREQKIIFSNEKAVSSLCDRRFGIGADGLILLENSPTSDFRMIYYNSDGKEGSMCGNGGRCIVAFAAKLGIIKHTTTFDATDGLHEAMILEITSEKSEVSLKMQDVANVEMNNHHYILNTGSPHYVVFADNIEKTDVVKEGRIIRNSERFKSDGINVNFVSGKSGHLQIKTYERGVEDETWSCGTGSVAAALAFELEGLALRGIPVEISTRGGSLKVSYKRHENIFTDIQLIGPTILVYEGFIDKTF